MTPFEGGLVAHFIADWILQNDWLAKNKVNLRHPAAWIHSGIHGLLLWFILDWRACLILAVLHLLIDTRLLLDWWKYFFRQTVEGEVGIVVGIFADQAIHIACLGAVVYLFYG